MMAWLTEWIRGVVAVVLFAVVLDMVLPNNTMQRYARVVMGILIILMMLSPILKMSGQSVYEMDLSLDTLLKGSGQELQSLESIQAEAEKLRTISEGQTVEQWKTGITEFIKKEVEKEHELSVERVDIQYKQDEQGQPLGLDSIHVVVAPRQELGVVEPIREVEQVLIGESAEQEVAQPVLSGQEKETVTLIRTRIAEDYQLPKTNVTVVWRTT